MLQIRGITWNKFWNSIRSFIIFCCFDLFFVAASDNFIGRRNEMMRRYKNDPCNVIRVYGYVKSTEPFRFCSIVYKARGPIYRNHGSRIFLLFLGKIYLVACLFPPFLFFFLTNIFYNNSFLLNNSEKIILNTLSMNRNFIPAHRKFNR